MNSKLVKASLAGAAAIALAAGGSTFAAWSDFGQFNNSVGAGILRLNLNANTQNPGDDIKFDGISLAPGIHQERQVYVASSDGQSVPNAKLFVSLMGLTGHENGCDTNSEASQELGAQTTAADPTAPCNINAGNSGTNPGQLIDQATFSVNSYVPTSPGVCNYSDAAGHPVTANTGYALSQWTTHNHHELTGTALTDKIASLAPGQGICVALVVELPSNNIAGLSYGNTAQGDKASFDVRFDLEQSA